jgi:hypothetical protein
LIGICDLKANRSNWCLFALVLLPITRYAQRMDKADSAALIFLLIVAILFSLGFKLMGNSSAVDLVEQWAIENGYTIVSRGRKFYGGSYFLMKSKSQRVHRVVVTDKEGKTRTADVKCGGYFMGMANPKMDVTWLD